MDARTRMFTLKVNDEEAALIRALAKKLERDQSDAVRWILRDAAKRHGVRVAARKERKEAGNGEGSANAERD